MRLRLNQYFAGQSEDLIELDLSYVRAKGSAEILDSSKKTVKYSIASGRAAYLVEVGSGVRFGRPTGLSKLKLAPNSSFDIELVCRILSGMPSISIYIMQYSSDGSRLQHSAVRHNGDVLSGTIHLMERTSIYAFAIRLSGYGTIEFGDLIISPQEMRSHLLERIDTLSRFQKLSLATRWLISSVNFLDKFQIHLESFCSASIELYKRIAERVFRRLGLSGKTPIPILALAAAETPNLVIDRSRSQLNELNQNFGVKARDELGGLLLTSIQFSLRFEIYETALRLAHFARRIWSTIDRHHQRQLLPPLVSAFIAAGNTNTAREFIEKNLDQVASDDFLVTCARLLQIEPADFGPFYLLPSGKLDVFTLSKPDLDRNRILAIFKNFPKLFTDPAENGLLLCNAFSVHNEARFKEHLNAVLSTVGTDTISSLSFTPQVLDGFGFTTRRSTKNGPVISVIMAARNAEETIGYSIKSILSQSYQNIELLVCDDASTDNTIATIRQVSEGDCRVRLFCSAETQGPYNIRNALIAKASGEYITFQDADDLALPSRIENQYLDLKAKKAVAVLGRWIRIRPQGTFVFFRDQSAVRNALVSILAKKTTFDLLGPYRSVKFGGDTEFRERIRIKFGEASVYQTKRISLIGLWSEKSLTRGEGNEGTEDGYRGPARRRLAELTTRQRLLGPNSMPEERVLSGLAEFDVLIKPSIVQQIN